MARTDLLALTPDDLAALANRGLVKRAQKEVEAGELQAEWSEGADGTIEARWSDEAACQLPGGKTLKEAKCNCGALDLCRHVLRTVLAWQQRQTAGSPEAEAKPPEAWDPGRITDTLVESQVPKAVRDRAGILWSQGVLAEVLRSAKPSAHFHCPGHTVRFPVPDDLRYAQCSCADPAPCVHAVLGVRAFRLLAPDAASGIISEGPLDLPVAGEPLLAAEACVGDLVAEGFAALSPAWRDRVRRVAGECAGAALVWPAQILEELAEDFDHYTARDATFNPATVVERAGELLLRIDAILAGCAPVPQAFIRGMRSDRDSELGSARFIGLGASVSEGRQSSVLTVFLQDCDNGHVVTLVRETSEDPDGATPRKAFHQLARAAAVKDSSLASLAAGQLLMQGGKRTAAGRLIVGRARAVVNPQNFAWEHLKAPVLVEDFSELTARLRLLPPASFRPRRTAADFHVCPLESIEHATFDPSTNAIVATVRDRVGGLAMLSHPWSERGKTGAEALLGALVSGAKPVFVAGHVRASGASGSTLLFHPTAMVFAGEGATRRGILPWIESASPMASQPVKVNPTARRPNQNRYALAMNLMVEVITNGLRRISGRQWPGWSRAVTELEEQGYHRMATLIRRVQQAGLQPVEALRTLKALAIARDLSA